MADNAQIRIRLVVDDSGGGKGGGAGGAKKQGLLRKGESPDDWIKRATKEEYDKNHKKMIREWNSALAKKAARFEGPAKATGGFARGIGGQIFQQSGGSGGARTAIGGVAAAIGTEKAMAAAKAGGAVMGAAEMFRMVIPLIEAAMAELVGTEGDSNNPLNWVLTMVSGAISEAFNAVGATLGAVKPALEYSRYGALFGYDISPGAVNEVFWREQAIDAERKDIQSRFELEINKEVAQGLMREALGRNGP